MRSVSARIASIFAAILIGLGIVAVAPSSPANASSQTCIIVKGGTMCTKFYEGNWQTFVGEKCVGLS